MKTFKLMQVNRTLTASVVLLLVGLLFFAVPAAHAAVTLNLPAGAVSASYIWNASGQVFTTTLSGFGAGYDVVSGVPYVGWCVERNSGPAPDAPPNTFSVNLYSSYDPALPANLKNWGATPIPWDKINWVLNNKGANSTSTIARTIWSLVEGVDNSGGDANAVALTAAANANGAGYEPPANGGIVAVILTNGSGINTTNDNWQENIIEVKRNVPTAVTLSSFDATSASNDLVSNCAVILGLVTGLLGIVGAGIWKFASPR